METRRDVSRFRQVLCAGLLAAWAALHVVEALAFDVPTVLFKAEPIRGRVVDSTTAEPIEGVAVLAAWQTRRIWLAGIAEKNVTILETQTDKQGNFHVPGWGPTPVVGLMGQPKVHLFKSGYRSMTLGNMNSTTNEERQRFEHDGKTASLERFDGPLQDYAEDLATRLGISLNSLTFVGAGLECEWRRFPKMLLALDEQQQQFDKAGVQRGWFYSSLRGNAEFHTKSNCGSLSRVLDEARSKR